MDVDEVLLLISRYGFAAMYRNPQEVDMAWNTVTAAVKQLSHDSYTKGIKNGNDSESNS